MMIALLALSGCRFYQDDAGDSSPPPALPYGACDPVILIPSGVLVDSHIPAEPHQAVFGAEPEPWHVRYQWPSMDPSRSAAFLWRTDVDTLASQIRIAPTREWPNGAETLDGASFLFGSGTVGQGEQRIHELRLCETLEPATTYTYQVGGEGHWSGEISFTTPGPPGSFDTFRVAFAGDSRGAYDTWEQMIKAMETHAPDFYVFSGDMVELGVNQEEWDAWFDAGDTVFGSKAMVPAHGNHEFLAQAYFAQFALPGNEEWFAIQYGGLLLLTLNDTVRGNEEVSVIQAGFIDETLSAYPSQWKLAQHHQAAYSSSGTHGSKASVRDAWVPLFDKHNVNLVVAGHNHVYERSVPIFQDSESPTGTTYMVSGGAGAPLYTSQDEQWFSAVFNPIHHYVIADFSAEQVDVVARDLDGNVIDSFTLTAAP